MGREISDAHGPTGMGTVVVLVEESLFCPFYKKTSLDSSRYGLIRLFATAVTQLQAGLSNVTSPVGS